MSWRFVYCPSCGMHQEKVGGAEEHFFCRECCTNWVEDKQKRVKKR